MVVVIAAGLVAAGIVIAALVLSRTRHPQGARPACRGAPAARLRLPGTEAGRARPAAVAPDAP